MIGLRSGIDMKVFRRSGAINAVWVQSHAIGRPVTMTSMRANRGGRHGDARPRTSARGLTFSLALPPPPLPVIPLLVRARATRNNTKTVTGCQMSGCPTTCNNVTRCKKRFKGALSGEKLSPVITIIWCNML